MQRMIVEFCTIRPPLLPMEQNRIVAALNDRVVAMGPLREAIESELSGIALLPGALLRSAFSGEL
jgi:hypothetical protein